jgi:putative tricarboxylic transport membrane protein
MIDNLLLGLQTAGSFNNLLFCLIGVIIGTIVGIIPGIGTVATISLLLPITYTMSDPTAALIMMAGIYYGSQYGGSITSILLNLPGEISSVVSVKDGYAMNRQGYAGAALGVAAIGSFFAGCIATMLIAFLSPTLIKFSLLFGPSEYFALMLFGLTCAAIMSNQNVVKGLLMCCVGMMIGMIGIESNTGKIRYIFNFWELAGGVSFLAICMGLYGLGEIMYYLLHQEKSSTYRITQIKIFTKKTWKKITSAWKSILRGSAVGSVVGLIPGAGAILSSFVSYAIEKRIAKDKSKFGKGDIRGIAGPESANNAGAQTSFIPMLSLGLPITPVMALLMSTMIVHNIQPGPGVINSNPELFWGLIMSMLIGNLFLVIINLGSISLLLKILKIPMWLISIIVMTSCIGGIYIVDRNFFNVILLLIFGIFGYLFKKYKFDVTALLLGFLLGPKMEESFRQALQIAQGNIYELFSSHISQLFYVFSLFVIWYFIKKK